MLYFLTLGSELNDNFQRHPLLFPEISVIVGGEVFADVITLWILR